MLPVTLDVGCNNEARINDPMYMGWKHPRITGDEYYKFVDEFIQAVKLRWPKALLQFEDFAQDHATPLLNRYRNELCCFNDDIQGTAAVALGTLLAACKLKGERLRDQKIVFAGAGSAGCGIAEQLVRAMMDEGLSEQEAHDRIFLISKYGLLQTSSEGLFDFQKHLCVSDDVVNRWKLTHTKSEDVINLLDVIVNAQPSVLIGVSGQPGLFTKKVIEAVLTYCERPIILPLSNPTSQVEAQPADLLRWTAGKALIATGSPFAPVDIGSRRFEIAQCNNSYIFPGLGLGVISSKAKRITDSMMMAASRALANISTETNAYNELLKSEHALLPSLKSIREVSKIIALAVFKQAVSDGVAMPVPEELMAEKIEADFWQPEYREYRRTSF